MRVMLYKKAQQEQNFNISFHVTRSSETKASSISHYTNRSTNKHMSQFPRPKVENTKNELRNKQTIREIEPISYLIAQEMPTNSNTSLGPSGINRNSLLIATNSAETSSTATINFVAHTEPNHCFRDSTESLYEKRNKWGEDRKRGANAQACIETETSDWRTPTRGKARSQTRTGFHTPPPAPKSTTHDSWNPRPSSMSFFMSSKGSPDIRLNEPVGSDFVETSCAFRIGAFSQQQCHP